jgi:hypothetical protein
MKHSFLLWVFVAAICGCAPQEYAPPVAEGSNNAGYLRGGLGYQHNDRL